MQLAEILGEGARFCARAYDPQIGRFLQQDPDPGKLSNPSTLNSKYIYTGNTPTLFRDPSGMSILGDMFNHIVYAGHVLVAELGSSIDQFIKTDLMFAIVFFVAAIYVPGPFLAAVASTIVQSSASGDWSSKTMKNQFYTNLAISIVVGAAFDGVGNKTGITTGWESGIAWPAAQQSIITTGYIEAYKRESNLRTNTQVAMEWLGNLITKLPPLPQM